MLNISEKAAAPLRYQLLHRTVSALLQARQYRSKLAVMLVQSFSQDEASFVDYLEFLRAIGLKDTVKRNILLGPIERDGVSLYFGWIDDKPPPSTSETAYLDDLRNYADKLSQWCDRVRNWCAVQRAKHG